MSQSLTSEALDQLFNTARTYNAWLDSPVTDAELHAIVDLMKMGPTSANSSPARIIFVRTPAAKARLIPCLSAGNQAKTREAPVTAIIGYDLAFYEKLPFLFPHDDARSWFAGNETAIQTTAFRNSSLQGGYFIMATRAVGLDCGPMSGYDSAKLDAEFFPDGMVKSNFICNLGHGDASRHLHPRSPRFDFGDIASIL